MSDIIPKLSITVVTYNQGKWLAECLESIVTQVTNFPFEVIVGDDASTDELSLQILRDYADKYPHVIKPIFREKNIGPSKNYFDVVQHSRGEYIAHIDGDDLMLPGKLQWQVDFLNANPDYSIVCHRLFRLCKSAEGNWVNVIEKDNFPEHGTIYDLLKHGCYIKHCSKMYRRSAIKTQDSNEPYVIDYFLNIEHASSGKIYYSQQIFGCYRIHGNNITLNNKWIELINQSYEKAFEKALELGIEKFYVQRGRIRHTHAIALTELSNKNFTQFKRFGFLKLELLKYAPFKALIIHLLTLMPNFAFYLLTIKQKLVDYKIPTKPNFN